MARLGWLESRPGKSGITWRARWHAPTRTGETTVESESFNAAAYGGSRKAKEAAEAFLAKKLTEVREGRYLAPVKMTLGELIEEWFLVRRGDVSGHTIYSERSVTKNHIFAHPEFAGLPIQAVTANHIERHYATLREADVGPSTIETVHRIVRGALNRAVGWGFLTASPTSKIKPPTGESRSLKYWTPEQSAHFLAAEGTDPQHGLVWRILLLTGMRIGELIALRWTDVDLQRQTIRIERTLTRDGEGTAVIGTTTKTQNARRTLQIPASCVEALKQHRTQQRARQLASPSWETKDGDMVFTQIRHPGRHLRYESVRLAFIEAHERSGLPPLTMHGLRHSFATAMLLAGVHPKTASEILGDTVEMVLRVYSHVTEGAKVDAMAVLDAQMARLVADA